MPCDLRHSTVDRREPFRATFGCGLSSWKTADFAASGLDSPRAAVPESAARAHTPARRFPPIRKAIVR